MKDDYFTIRLRESTVKKLKSLWRNHEDTYDTIINKLMDDKK